MSNMDRNFRQTEKFTRFTSNNDRINEQRINKRDFFLNRSNSQQIERTLPYSPNSRKPSFPSIKQFDFSQKQHDIFLKSLPISQDNDIDDPLSQICLKNKQITEKILSIIDLDCKTMINGAEILSDCPYTSKTFFFAQSTKADLETRVKFLTSLEKGSPSDLTNIF